MPTPLAEPLPYVSTGQLPTAEEVKALVNEAHRRYRDHSEGQVSPVYPALATANPALFGLCVAASNGQLFPAGDAAHEFSIMSVSKPFVFALACEVHGHETVRAKIGANSTGLPFNSLSAVEQSLDGRTNPMVNAGAMATSSLIPGTNLSEKWAYVLQGLSRFAGRPLNLNAEVYESSSATNFRNRSIAYLLHSRNRVYCDPLDAVDLYTRQCALNVSAQDLALMGATLASGGVNPVTGQRVVSQRVCHYTLAVMATAGLYETSGDWLYDIGVPGKSGIGGGIVVVAPGKGGLGTFSPPLDRAGNSVRGILSAKFLSEQLGLDLFASTAG